MEKKFNIVVGEDGTVKLPDEVLKKLEVKPGEEVRFEVDDNFYAVRLLSRIEAERLDYLNWMHIAEDQLGQLLLLGVVPDAQDVVDAGIQLAVGVIGQCRVHQPLIKTDLAAIRCDFQHIVH